MTPDQIQNALNEAVMNIQTLQEELDELKSNSCDATNSHKELVENIAINELKNFANKVIVERKEYLDYTHLLPAGYEFCTEEEAEDWIKVECPEWNEPQSPIGTIQTNEDIHWFKDNIKSLYRPVRKIQYHIAVHEAVTVEPTPYNLLLLADGRKFRISDKIKMAYHDGMVLITPISIDANHFFNQHELKPEYLGLPKIDRIEDIPNPYAVDWSNAPEWADTHAYDQNEIGVFYGVEQGERQYKPKWSASGLLLPPGLDWKQSKTVRPR